MSQSPPPPSMQMPTKQQLMAAGPPYPPAVQSLGAPATRLPDVPASAVFLALFAFTGIAHMTLFQRNRRRGHKFVLSGAMFAYCLLRVITMAMRIATVYNPRNISLGLAAAVFVAVGTIILYVVNFFFAQRLFRARHPHIGWHPSFRYLLPVLPIVLTAICIVMVIIAVIQSFFTLNERTRSIDRHIQQAALTWFTVVAFLPLPIVALILVLPRSHPIDKFGAGRYRTKLAIIAASAMVLTLGAGFRCGLSFVTPVPRGQPTPWYYSKACFYVFDFTFEYAVVLAYLILRVDKRFHVPNGAHGYGSYAAGSGGVVGAEKGFESDDVEGAAKGISNGPSATADGKEHHHSSSASLTNGNANTTNDTAHEGRVLDKELEQDRTATADTNTDAASSVTSDIFALGVNRKSGRYEMRRMSQSTLGTTDGKT